MNNHDEVQGMAKGDYNSRIAEMMMNRFLGGGPVEPPTHEVTDYPALGERLALADKAEREREEEGLTWVGWLEKYSSYAKREGEREGEGTPIFQQTLSDELTYRDYQDKKLAEVKQLGVDGWANEDDEILDGF